MRKQSWSVMRWIPLTKSAKMLVIMATCVLAPMVAQASMSRFAGVDSNILVTNDRVYFVQGDGSLTVLALDTGTVLTQDINIGHGPVLLTASPTGLVVRYGYGSCRLLDWHTLKVGPFFKPDYDEDDPKIEIRLCGFGYYTKRSLTNTAGTTQVIFSLVCTQASGELTAISGRRGTNSWYGVLPYLTPWSRRWTVSRCDNIPRRVYALTEAGERLLLGTEMGQIECVDAATGLSLWMYTFPARQQLMSYSHVLQLPYVKDTIEQVERDNAAKRVSTGICIVPESTLTNEALLSAWLSDPAHHSRPKLLHDPRPCEWYKDYGRYCAQAWAASLLPLVAGLALLGVHLWRRVDCRLTALMCILLSAGPLWGMLFCSRVSYASNLAQRYVWVLLLLCAITALIQAVRRWHWISVLLLAALIVAVLYWFWYPAVICVLVPWM